ncbi:MAG TPA: hypothetical protein VMD05_05260 [Candidatus Nanoarchaeia archaeon]|nr:hypothetical protein [Candidatus Nanoarchaeia archaeon]
MKKPSLRRNNSGQVLIVTSLLVALLLLSTIVFVMETEKDVPTIKTEETDPFISYQQTEKNTLISALANITKGGNSSILASDLETLNTAITSDSYLSMLQINYEPLNATPYQNGIWISWNDSQGITSAAVSFALNSSGLYSTSNIQYTTNVTSEISQNGNNTRIEDSLRQVNLTINLQNENGPALAQNFTFSFENTNSSWVKVDSPNITDFDNGTYTVTFNIETAQTHNPIYVQTLCQDQRGIITGANTTCGDVPP